MNDQHFENAENKMRIKMTTLTIFESRRPGKPNVLFWEKHPILGFFRVTIQI